MLNLRYPPFSHKVRGIAGQPHIFDVVRKKWLVLTPEEWTRQHVINYLITERSVPISMISVEKEIQLNDLRRRYDVVVYNSQHQPWLVIECKAPYVKLDQPVLEQALRYDLVTNTGLIVITNGIDEHVYRKGTRISEIPDWKESQISY